MRAKPPIAPAMPPINPPEIELSSSGVEVDDADADAWASKVVEANVGVNALAVVTGVVTAAAVVEVCV